MWRIVDCDATQLRDSADQRCGGLEIVYGVVTEPWGVRRFYVRDPFGKTINILAHASPAGIPPERS